MARTSHKPNTARRTLLAFIALVLVLAGVLAGANIWGTAGLAPRLGLDLEGGTQLVLSPRLVGDQKVTSDQVAQARDIISERVDAQGTTGAEVTTQGADNIVVSMPGDPTRQQEDSLRRSSMMQFRPVLYAAPGTNAPAPPVPTPSANPSGSGTSSPSGTKTSGASNTSSTTPRSTSTTSSSRDYQRQSLKAASSSSSTTPSSSGTSSTKPSGSGTSGTQTPTGTPTAPATPPKATAPNPDDPTDINWATPELQAQFAALDCAKPGVLDKIVDDPKKPLITCSTDNVEKFILGPVAVEGADITDAVAGYQTTQTGQPSNIVEIQLSFNSKAAKIYAALSQKMLALPSPQNRLASTLDSRVIVAPQFNSVIPNGQASITGNFSFTEAQDLAKQLKFGALPISFDLQTRSQISPTLGKEQLRLGMIAGLIGLLLVVIYSLFQYRMLGLVTVGSLVMAALLTYLVITLLGWSQNMRLDMAGVTGLIVAIGVTADSFIVYFERIRDEVREGRTLRTAVDTGWARARRTVLAADGVNFLGALVLYLLATSSVRGFAFTLGLTTLIDVLVVFMFTHPVVSLIARVPFFRDGHRWSGLDPERLGAKTSRYVGRGRFAGPRPGTVNEGSQA